MKKSIFFRILVPILSLLLLCTVTVSVVIYTFAQRLLYEDITDRSGALLVQIDGNFSNLMQQLNTIINVSDSSLYFRMLLTEPCENQIDLFEKEMELHRFLYNYYSIFTQFKACMTVLGKNGVSYTTYDGKKLIVSPDALLQEDWAAPLTDSVQYEKIVNTLSHPGISTVTEGQNVLLFARSLVDGYTMERCGLIFLEINPAGFEQLYAKSYSEGEYIFITDLDGNVISSNRHDIIGNRLENIDDVPLYTSNASRPVTSLHIRSLDGRNCLAIRIRLSSIDGYLVKYIDTDIIARQLNAILFWIVGIAAFFCIAACLFSIILFRHLTNPLVRLSKQMASTRYGRVDDLDKESSGDEIQMLERTFSKLLTAIDSYTENIQQESNARREAELNTLRMQINPHFLYNTLSSIRYLIENGCERAKIGDAFSSFICLLRGTISNKKEQISLSDEIHNLEAYISLMNLRYDGRIHFQVFRTDKSLDAHLVPKLILQPIVENSIFHGFPSENSSIEITLYISEFNHVLQLEIVDSGCGIDSDTLDELSRGTFNSSRSMNGVGLSNIDQRLKLIYGPQYGLKICSSIGMGTIVTIHLPA